MMVKKRIFLYFTVLIIKKSIAQHNHRDVKENRTDIKKTF